jgi:hypothetical protein
MNGTRKNARDHWGGYIGLVGLLCWGILVPGFHAKAWYSLAGVFLIVAVIGGIMWGAGMVRRHSRAATPTHEHPVKRKSPGARSS